MDYYGGIPALPKISCFLLLPLWITKLFTSHPSLGVETSGTSDNHSIGSSTTEWLSMAAAAVAPQSNGVGPPTDPAEREAWEISQYEKIIEIRDQVFAGTHPRLKLLFPVDPATGEALSTVNSQPSTNLHNPGNLTHSAQAGQSLQASVEQSHLPLPPRPPNVQSKSPSNVSAATGASGIDPIFLTKSDVLLRAEIQQKRQRIERILADQVKEKQASSKQRYNEQDDLPDLDVTEILRKAHELVKPVKFADISGANGNASASDSFDENTFYSSQMNDSTPEAAEKPEPPRNPTMSQNCNYFMRGEKCPYGDKCTYAHNPAARPALPVQKPQVQTSNINANPQTPSNTRVVALQDSTDRHLTTESNSNAERIAELEAQIRALQSQGSKDKAGPSQIDTRKAQEAQEEESAYSPPDAVPPKTSEILPGRRKDARQQQRQSPIQTRAAPREYPRYDNVAQSSSSVGEGHVVRNHITSPVAPQPARVSPLAVARAPPTSQGKRQQRQINESFREPANGTIPVQTTQTPRQATNPKKRKKARESGEMVRNVIPRREPPSPEIRVKEEPTSPPPFVHPAERWDARPQQEAREPIYVDEVSPRYREQGTVVYRSNVIDRPAPRYVLDDYREAPPPRYEPDLRRVVSTRQLRPPMIDTERYSSPQPPLRAASQIYIPRQEQEVPRQYRSSVQPEPVQYLDHDQDLSPRTREVPSVMAPPPRRIVVDQYGNQFYEQEVAPMPRPRQSSMVPLIRQGPPDRSFQSPAPRHSVARIPQAVENMGETRYIHQRPSPPPQYIEYVSPARARPPLNRDADSYHGHEIQPRRGDEVRVVEYPSQNANGRYEEVRPMGEVTRGSSVRPVGHRYENSSEQISRVQSVRPEGRRVVSYGGEMIPQGTRQVSIRPEEAYVRPPVDYGQSRIQYYSGPDGRV
ncbi:MAG: hypothetical protein L6R41_005859 [Letrouitia leprolyta]|nr:MAG: hypothetical protein L6R41_005859 [Letrouitia leprolyta]